MMWSGGDVEAGRQLTAAVKRAAELGFERGSTAGVWLGAWRRAPQGADWRIDVGVGEPERIELGEATVAASGAKGDRTLGHRPRVQSPSDLESVWSCSDDPADGGRRSHL